MTTAFVRRALLGVAALAMAAVVAALALGPRSSDDRGLLTRIASIGGAFELTTHEGRRLASTSLAGRPFVVFFGFTRCPDICPTTLLEMSNHLAALGEMGDRLTTLFVTIDPEHDTAEHLAAYLNSFDPRITGLTGSPAEIAHVARMYRAYYEKVPTSGGYTMNHTATVYLMDRQGNLAGTMSFQEPESTQREKLARLIGG